MERTNWRLLCALALLVAGWVCLGTVPAVAQLAEPPTTEPPVTEPLPPDTGGTDPQPPEVGDGEETQTPSTANPPAYIREIIEAQTLTQVQVDQMRADGLGWGEIRIAAGLAQKISANSGGALALDAALAQVLAARAEGKGWGEIAAANNVKVGDLVGNRGQKVAGEPQSREAANKGRTISDAAKEKKPGLLARIGRALGLGRSADKPAKPAKLDRPEESPKTSKGDKPERPVRLEHSARPEKPVRLEKPAKPEKPERGHGR